MHATWGVYRLVGFLDPGTKSIRSAIRLVGFDPKRTEKKETARKFAQDQ